MSTVKLHNPVSLTAQSARVLLVYTVRRIEDHVRAQRWETCALAHRANNMYKQGWCIGEIPAYPSRMLSVSRLRVSGKILKRLSKERTWLENRVWRGIAWYRERKLFYFLNTDRSIIHRRVYGHVQSVRKFDLWYRAYSKISLGIKEPNRER